MSVSTPILTLSWACAVPAKHASTAPAIASFPASLIANPPCQRAFGPLSLRSVAAGHQRTVIILHRTESLIGRDGGTQLVVIARIFGFRRRLHVEHVSRM